MLGNHAAHDGLKTTVLGLSSISSAFANLSSSSVLPIACAAAPICRISSCSLLKHLMMDPSNTSVNYRGVSAFTPRIQSTRALTLQISLNLAPLHHCNTASIISTLKVWTYSSSTSAMPDSVDTLAIRRAVSCSTRSGVASSSFSLTFASD